MTSYLMVRNDIFLLRLRTKRGEGKLQHQGCWALGKARTESCVESVLVGRCHGRVTGWEAH